MTLEKSEWTRTLDWMMYHEHDCQADPAPVVSLIQHVRSAFGQYPSGGDLVVNRLGSLRLRTLKPTERNWAKAIAEVNAGTVSTLGFDFQQLGGDAKLLVSFQLSHTWERLHYSDPLAYSFVYLMAELRAVEADPQLLSACQTLLREAWLQLRGCYAFADVFVAAVPGFMVTEELSRKLMALPYTTAHIVPGIDLATSVPGAYWTNYLSASQVLALGGFNKLHRTVAEALPLATVGALPNDGISIQLKASPVYEDTETWQHDHVTLAEIIRRLH